MNIDKADRAVGDAAGAEFFLAARAYYTDHQGTARTLGAEGGYFDSACHCSGCELFRRADFIARIRLEPEGRRVYVPCVNAIGTCEGREGEYIRVKLPPTVDKGARWLLRPSELAPVTSASEAAKEADAAAREAADLRLG